LRGSLVLDCFAFRLPTSVVWGRETIMDACSCSRRANSAGVTSSGLALAFFFLVADCFAVAVADDFARTTGATELGRASALPGVVTMLVSSGGARGSTLLARFVAGVSAITSVNSSITEVSSWMEAGVGETVEALASSNPATGMEH
jgi:copper oxidase (laccase) domain-containing protein